MSRNAKRLRFKSKTMEAVHETAQALHSIGAISDARMRHFDKACLEDDNPAAPVYQVYKDRKGEWRWRLAAANGRIIAASGESYKTRKTRKACLSGIALVKRSADADVAA